MVTLEALTRFSLAVPFEGIQDLQVQISTPSRSLNKRRLIDQNRARPALQHLQVPAAEDLEMKASGRGRGTISVGLGPTPRPLWLPNRRNALRIILEGGARVRALEIWCLA